MNYTCPYCGTHTTITSPNHYSNWDKIDINESTLGNVGFRISAITCPNVECKKMKLTGELIGRDIYGQPTNSKQKWQLLPESEAKVLPQYIPNPIQNDYYEACRIRDLSPKASAALSRRCLQGMIRDFYGISKQSLYDEIKELENKVDKDVWESIDAVRKVGNIGAHMKKDINTIVEVEPDEAQLLIGLIEQLIDEWYVARNDRQERAAKLKQLVARKEVGTNKEEEVT